MTDFESDDRFDDPFVPIWEGPTTEAARLSRLIETSHIPVDLGDALSAGEARVEVPRSYRDEALEVLAAGQPNRPGLAESIPMHMSSSSTSFAPVRDSRFDAGAIVRLALAAVALGLILLMLLNR